MSSSIEALCGASSEWWPPGEERRWGLLAERRAGRETVHRGRVSDGSLEEGRGLIVMSRVVSKFQSGHGVSCSHQPTVGGRLALVIEGGRTMRCSPGTR